MHTELANKIINTGILLLTVVIVYKMTTCRRSGFKQTINEILSLQREYELLSLSVSDIADRHERSFFSILNKLKIEGFIDETTCHKEVMSNKHRSSNKVEIDYSLNDCSSVSDDNTEMDDRISFLETAVKDIGSTLSKLLKSVYGKNNTGISCNTYQKLQ